MDNGTEQLGHSNQSIYSPVIKALIDEFVAEHAERIDTDRIVVAGLSNGGFMTLRLCADYPDFFAAGLPCCAPWYNATDEDVAALAKTPLCLRTPRATSSCRRSRPCCAHGTPA